MIVGYFSCKDKLPPTQSFQAVFVTSLQYVVEVQLNVISAEMTRVHHQLEHADGRKRVMKRDVGLV